MEGESCLGIIQEGKAKGKRCERTPGENKYCGKHQRNKEYDDKIKAGKKLCSKFFRGCNNEITGSKKTCDDCLGKKYDTPVCKICTNHVKEKTDIYCGKHTRHKYYDEEKEKGITYCDIERGCFTPCKEGFKSCNDCLKKNREKDNARFEERSALLSRIISTGTTTKRVCVKCSGEFEAFLTDHGEESKRCTRCRDTMRKQDEKRADRERAYKAESLKHYETYYKQYYTKAHKRELKFELTLEQFAELIQKPCQYCNHSKEGDANGIDRMNNTIGYIVGNCVPCCEMCNRMKAFYHPLFFIQKAKYIATKTSPPKEFYLTWKTYYERSVSISYTGYKNEIEKQKREFNITLDEFKTITRSPCYLCEYTSGKGVGIDRVDNSIRSYTIENCKPCCGGCNNMKCDSSLEDILTKCDKINKHITDLSMYAVIPMFENPLKRSKVIEVEEETKEEEIKEESKTEKWNSKKLYHGILSNTLDSFLEFNKDVLSKKEFDSFVKELQQKYKKEDEILPILKTFLYKIRYRRSGRTVSILTILEDVSTEPLSTTLTHVGDDEIVKPLSTTLTHVEDDEIVKPLSTTLTHVGSDTPATIKWTAATLYTNIMANTPDSFLELNKDVLTREDFDTFVKDLKTKYATKETAIPVLKTYMNTMRCRRARHAKKELE